MRIWAAALLSTFIFACTIAVWPSQAGTMPAVQGGGVVPDIQVVDEADQAASFSSTLEKSGQGPIILLPVYTRCAASCPILTRKVDSALASLNSGEAHRIILISFDPAETAQTLKVFRNRERIPADWKILRTNVEGVRRFFSFFKYTVMREGGILVHPNEVFLLDERLDWRLTLVGENWSSEEFATALESTRNWGFAARLGMNPEKLAWAGFTGLVTGLSFIVGWLVFRKPSTAVGS